MDSKPLGLAVLDFIDFELKTVSQECVEGSFIVSPNSSQPFGVLHGGISAFIAETIASTGAYVASKGKHVAGIELNINHLRAVSIGKEVKVVGTPLLLAQRIQVWEVKLSSEDLLVSVSRVTLTVRLSEAPRKYPLKNIMSKL